MFFRVICTLTRASWFLLIFKRSFRLLRCFVDLSSIFICFIWFVLQSISAFLILPLSFHVLSAKDARSKGFFERGSCISPLFLKAETWIFLFFSYIDHHLLKDSKLFIVTFLLSAVQPIITLQVSFKPQELWCHFIFQLQSSRPRRTHFLSSN